VGKFKIAVVVVSGEDQTLGADELRDVRAHLLFHLERVIHLPAFHLFARRFGEPWHGQLEKLEVFVEPFHPVVHPAAARLHERELEARKALQQAAGDDTKRRNHLLEGMCHGVGEEGMVETLRAGGHAVADVDADGEVETLGLGEGG